jgi:hypothetical protein
LRKRQIDGRATLQAIHRAFEVAGVEFIDENGRVASAITEAATEERLGYRPEKPSSPVTDRGPGITSAYTEVNN